MIYQYIMTINCIQQNILSLVITKLINCYWIPKDADLIYILIFIWLCEQVYIALLDLKKMSLNIPGLKYYNFVGYFKKYFSMQ